MSFDLQEAAEVLQRTPLMLEALLSGLSEAWMHSNEGDGTWTAAEVVDHLIEAEKTNWIPRLEFLLMEGDSAPFPVFNRLAHLQMSSEAPLGQKLREFSELRGKSIARVRELLGEPSQWELPGLHPTLGAVKARELVSAWTVHDLTHLSQIARVMAKRYSADVGPFAEFLSILKQ